MFVQHNLAGIALGVNIDHIATLRNVRGTPYPDPLAFALMAQDAGADAITLHLREDRRHIREADVHAIKAAIHIRLNFESAITPEMIDFALTIRPNDVCLVPERRAELTTEGGLDVCTHLEAVKVAVTRLQQADCRVSLFIDPVQDQIEAALETGAQVIELHTGAYAHAAPMGVQDPHNNTDTASDLWQKLLTATEFAQARGLKVHAGHGLTRHNVSAIAAINGISELNIGHAIVARALEIGFAAAVREINALMIQAHLHPPFTYKTRTEGATQ